MKLNKLSLSSATPKIDHSPSKRATGFLELIECLRVRSCLLPMIVLIGLLCGGPQAYSVPENDQGRAVLTLLAQMESSYAGVEDYTAVLQKQERVDGELLPEETIL